MLTFLVDAYDEEVVAERERTALRLHPQLAPVKVAVLPLIPRNTDIAGKAHALYEELRRAVVAEYDDSGQIGTRYRRQDEIGTPYALDDRRADTRRRHRHDRDRDSLAQERIPISGARAFLLDKLAEDWTTLNGLEAPALERALARLGEAELPVQVVGVGRMQEPLLGPGGAAPGSTLKRTSSTPSPWPRCSSRT